MLIRPTVTVLTGRLNVLPYDERGDPRGTIARFGSATEPLLEIFQAL